MIMAQKKFRTAVFAAAAILLISHSAPCLGRSMEQLHVTIILASNNGPSGIDPAAAYLKGALSRLNFSSYRLLQRLTLPVTQNSPSTLALPEGKSLEISYNGTEGNYTSINVRIMGDGYDYVNTSCRLLPGTPFIVGGPSTSRGSIIIAITPAG